MSVITHTSGVDRYHSNHPHSPSLCMLFQRGRCNAGQQCNQIHVDRPYAAAIRQLLHTTPLNNCCDEHGDIASQDSKFVAEFAHTPFVELRSEGYPSIRLSRTKIGRTEFWARVHKGRGKGLFFTPDRVCTLHQRHQCTYGPECKNAHVCREFWQELVATGWGGLSPAQSPESEESTGSTTPPTTDSPAELPQKSWDPSEVKAVIAHYGSLLRAAATSLELLGTEVAANQAPSNNEIPVPIQSKPRHISVPVENEALSRPLLNIPQWDNYEYPTTSNQRAQEPTNYDTTKLQFELARKLFGDDFQFPLGSIPDDLWALALPSGNCQ